jgi:hypothetical protein
MQCDSDLLHIIETLIVDMSQFLIIRDFQSRTSNNSPYACSNGVFKGFMCPSDHAGLDSPMKY